MGRLRTESSRPCLGRSAPRAVNLDDDITRNGSHRSALVSVSAMHALDAIERMQRARRFAGQFTLAAFGPLRSITTPAEFVLAAKVVIPAKGVIAATVVLAATVAIAAKFVIPANAGIHGRARWRRWCRFPGCPASRHLALDLGCGKVACAQAAALHCCGRCCARLSCDARSCGRVAELAAFAALRQPRRVS